MNLDQMRKLIFMKARKYDYELITDRINIMAEKFLRQEKVYGDIYCPCQAKKDEDTLCPCKFMREHNACRCGLFKQGKAYD